MEGNGKFTGPLTPTERRMYEVLKDGEPHSQHEIFACLDDQLSQRSAIKVHLSKLRSKLPSGYELICQFIFRKRQYRIVRHLYADKPQRVR